jgi:sugar/nucleoside kinase (ribokinase family)
MPSYPDYLVIGHVTKDLYDGGYKLGGTATYSALTARQLGCTVGIVTSHGPDIVLDHLPSDICIVTFPSESSTTFENLYHDGQRRQFLWSQAQVLTSSHVPDQWSNSPIVHLGPIAQEVDPALAQCFPNALLGLTPQGWMREWDEQNIVHHKVWHPPEQLLERADVVILSQEDVDGDMARVSDCANRACLLVLTAGWKGSSVYYDGERRSFPAPSVNEVDPTGAGDIFAAVYLIALHRSQDPWLSAQFANCVAAHSVERSGLASIPTRQEIEGCCRKLDCHFLDSPGHATGTFG